jgi:hypothetical protein
MLTPCGFEMTHFRRGRCSTRSRDYLHGLIEEVERSARRMANELGAELTDAFWEYVES